MGLFKKRQKNVKSIIKEYYGGNKGYFLYNYASNIYNIPEVRTAIETFANIFTTIPIYKERVDKQGNIKYFESKVLTVQANPLQNATQFWREVITRLMTQNNVFIEPVFDSNTGNLKAIYVLPFTSFEFNLLSDDEATVTFTEIQKTYRLKDLIYLNRFSFLSGGAKNNLGLYETVIQALAQQALNVADPKKVRALLQSKTGTTGNFKPTDKTGAMKDMKLNFDENVNGIAYMDQYWQVTPINWQENDVNRELMELVKNTVYEYFGITDNIINGKANEMEITQFVNYKVQPIAIQIEREFTSKLFTEREREFGDRIELDTFALTLKTTGALTALLNVTLRQGVMNPDEAREYLGLPPLPDGLGQMYRTSADTIDIKEVNKYQAAQKGVVEDNKYAKEVEDESGKEE